MRCSTCCAVACRSPDATTAAALTESRRAVDLNPTLAAAFCGLGDSLCYEGPLRRSARPVRSRRRARHARSATVGVPVLRRGRTAVRRTVRGGAAMERAGVGDPEPAVLDDGTPRGRARTPRSHGRGGRSGHELRAECPHFTIAYARRKLFFLERSDQIDLYLRGCARPAFPSLIDRSPELPTSSPRLSAPAAHAGRTWASEPNTKTVPRRSTPNALRGEVRAKYREVAESPEATFHFHTGRELARRLGYDMGAVDDLPAWQSSRSPGSPTRSRCATSNRRAGRRRRIGRRVRQLPRRHGSRTGRGGDRRRHDTGDAGQVATHGASPRHGARRVPRGHR
jgi:hypothetical protein